MAYSENFKGEAMIKLAVNKYNYAMTASDLGIPEMTLRRWDKNVRNVTKNIPELLERAIQRMLMVIPADMSAHDWSIAVGILFDKWLLVQGKATSRTETVARRFGNLNEDELDDVLAEADRILEEVAGGSADQGAGED